MSIEKIQSQIDMTEYWDVNILDFNCSFFGDEVNLYIYNDKDTYWSIQFISCLRVCYQTDADRRTILNVRNMKKPQLGYYG